MKLDDFCSILESDDADRVARVMNTVDDERLPNLHNIVPSQHMHPIAKQGGKTVTIYRGVPDGVNEIRPGDLGSV